jgi:hypothetical protein
MSTLRVNNIQNTSGQPNLGKILQVVRAIQPDVFTSSNADGTWQDTPGMSATITPRNTSSQIIVMVSLGKVGGLNNNAFRILRNGTAWDVGVSAGSRQRINFSDSNQGRDANHSGSMAWMSVDSPATASAITYQLQHMPENVSGQVFRLNRSWNNTDATQGYNGSAASTIVLMEIGN